MTHDWLSHARPGHNPMPQVCMSQTRFRYACPKPLSGIMENPFRYHGKPFQTSTLSDIKVHCGQADT